MRPSVLHKMYFKNIKIFILKGKKNLMTVKQMINQYFLARTKVTQYVKHRNIFDTIFTNF